MPPPDQSDFTCSKCTPRKNPSIYKTGTLNRKLYKPQVVSFGPYHYYDGKDDLKPMEEHKDHAHQHFLERSQGANKDFLGSLRKVESNLEESYQAPVYKQKKDTELEFLDLMIRDGCFMLEIMRTTVEEKRDYPLKDPIFNSYRQKYTTLIQRDMLLLENQLPLQVLYQLVAMENNGEEPTEHEYKYINMLILKFFKGVEMPLADKCLHVLDVYRKGLLMVQPEQNKGVSLQMERKEDENKTESKDPPKMIQSATELKAWIRFEKSKTDSLNDISFSKLEGVLRLPHIEVNDTTMSTFLNLITFERLHVGAGNEITSYITFMDNIINTKRDVELLVAQGIIANALGDDTEVAKLFNWLCKEVPFQSTKRLDAVQKDICEYRKRCWNKVRATLKRWLTTFYRTYFRSPWSLVSVVAATFLFVLTIIQTVYAVRSYNSQIASV